MKIRKSVLSALSASALSLTLCGGASAATECVWIGGNEGNLLTASNWSPATAPSSSSKAYIAVFTNSVTLTTSSTSTHWYPSGIVISNNAVVTYASNYRCYPSAASENGEFVMSIENGSTFVCNAMLFGSTSLTLVKTGGGTLRTKSWLGNSNSSGSAWKSVDIQGGTVETPTGNAGMVNIADTLRIRAGTTVLIGISSPFGTKADYNLYQPRVVIDEGGVLNMNSKNVTISSLSGQGVVSNCVNTLTLNLRHSGETFSGRILGGGTLAVTPESGVSAEDAMWIVGSADALWGVSLVTNAVEGCSYDVRFVSGIDTFYAKTVPTDAPRFDTNGVPVEIALSGNFWYVDCEHWGGSGDGKSLATAFQTLSEAMNNSALAAGDTVWGAPGVYSNGTMASTSVNLSNRVSVAKDVRLVSLEGADRTVIVGANATSPLENGYGVGAGAVRCVKLGARSTLRGFSLRGGRTYSTTTGGQGDSNVGGGIHAEESSIIIGCVISNCVATRGGGAYHGTYYNCRFDANRALESSLVGAHVLYKARLFNCVLTGALNGCDWYGNQTDSLAVNCTFGTNGKGSTRGTSGDPGKHIVVYNSLVLAAPAGSSCDEFHSCVVSPKGSASPTFDSNCIATNLTASTSPTVYAFAGIDTKTLKPKKSSSILVGAADLATYRSLFPVEQYWLSEYDADFKKRVWGDSLDIGAFAYDRDVGDPGLMLIFR